MSQERPTTIETVPQPLIVERFPDDFRSRMGDYMRGLNRDHKTFRLFSIFVSPEEYQLHKKANELRKIDDPAMEFAKEFSTAYAKLRDGGFDGAAADVLLRWVGVDHEYLDDEKVAGKLNHIVRESEVNGGMVSKDAGLNMSDRQGRVDKAFKQGIERGESGVLFMYDGRKMDTLQGEEKDSKGIFAAGYGYKPKPGGTYRSALLGMVVIS
jgi:hypothetical protein